MFSLCAARIRRQRHCRFHRLYGFLCRIRTRPPCTWEHGRRAGRLQPLAGSPEVLLITTQGRPPGLLCRATGVSLSPAPQSKAKGLAFVPHRAKWIAQCRLAHTAAPHGEQQCSPSACHGAFPGVARMGGNVPAVLVCSCQATSARHFLCLPPCSQWQRAFLIALKKIF